MFLRPSNYYIDGEDRETVPSKVDCKQKLVVELCDEVFAYLIDQLTVEQLIAVVHKGALRCADCEWKYQHHEVIAVLLGIFLR